VHHMTHDLAGFLKEVALAASEHTLQQRPD
jgi:hypothetical protein